MFLKSFCDSYYIGDEEQNKRRNRTVVALRSLEEGMDLLGNLSSQNGKFEPCNQTVGSTTNDNGTNAIAHAWLAKVNNYAKEITDAETDQRKPKSWEDRQGLHEAVAKGFVEHFNNFTSKKR